MTGLLTLRLPENEKEALALSSQLSGMPISKVIMPFISEGTKVSLGASLLFRIDSKNRGKSIFPFPRGPRSFRWIWQMRSFPSQETSR
ncbi:MAG: hypothetical protein ACMUHY_00435 [Thermoplasmatota archaeon]